MTEAVELELKEAPVTRKLTRSTLGELRLTKLKEVVAKAGENGPFAILIAQIDPDAIGSAFGFAEVLKILGHEAQIYCAGAVSHPQNEALCNKYDLSNRMIPIGNLKETTRNVVLVDSCRAQDSRLPFKVDPVIVIDHHRSSDVEETANSFVWLDEDGVGSASTMIAELLSALAPDDWGFRSSLAVMLSLGIYTDTKSRNRAGERDEIAYAWCRRYADTTDLIRLILYKRPFSFLVNLSRAVAYVQQKDTYRQGRLLGYLGKIPEKQGDDLAMVGDEFLRTIGAPLALTWAVVEVKDPTTGEITLKVRVCARSEELSINLAEKLFVRFGKRSGAKILPDGTGEGGALFELPVVPWMTDAEMVEIVGKRIIEWFYDKEESTGEAE